MFSIYIYTYAIYIYICAIYIYVYIYTLYIVYIYTIYIYIYIVYIYYIYAIYIYAIYTYIHIFSLYIPFLSWHQANGSSQPPPVTSAPCNFNLPLPTPAGCELDSVPGFFVPGFLVKHIEIHRQVCL